MVKTQPGPLWQEQTHSIDDACDEDEEEEEDDDDHNGDNHNHAGIIKLDWLNKFQQSKLKMGETRHHHNWLAASIERSWEPVKHHLPKGIGSRNTLYIIL